MFYSSPSLFRGPSFTDSQLHRFLEFAWTAWTGQIKLKKRNTNTKKGILIWSCSINSPQPPGSTLQGDQCGLWIGSWQDLDIWIDLVWWIHEVSGRHWTTPHWHCILGWAFIKCSDSCLGTRTCAVLCSAVLTGGHLNISSSEDLRLPSSVFSSVFKNTLYVREKEIMNYLYLWPLYLCLSSLSLQGSPQEIICFHLTLLLCLLYNIFTSSQHPLSLLSTCPHHLNLTSTI